MNLTYEVEFTKYDKKRGITLPEKITPELAYFCGVLAGDGHLRYNENTGDYHIKCVGNPLNEVHFYEYVIKPIVRRLFGIEIKTKLLDGGRTYGFTLYSKTIITFLNSVLGMQCGRKAEVIEINRCFIQSNDLATAFIRGFADADFCLTLKKRYKKYNYYPVIVGVSKSITIMRQICNFLESNDFCVSKDFNRTYSDKRFNDISTTHRIQMYGHSQLSRWMSIIGFNNPKHIVKYRIWKERIKTHSWHRLRSM